MSFELGGVTKPGVLLTWTDNGGGNHTIYFDATTNEQHSSTAHVTTHKVESGPDITDHIRPLPRRLSLQAVITNTPLVTYRFQNTTQIIGQVSSSFESVSLSPTLLNQGQTLQNAQDMAAAGFPSAQVTAKPGSPEDRAVDAYLQIDEARSNGYLIAVFTSLNAYENMAIESFVPQRSARSGNALEFSMELREVVTVSTVQVDAPAPRIQKKKKSNKPNKAPDAKQEEKIESVWHASRAKK